MLGALVVLLGLVLLTACGSGSHPSTARKARAVTAKTLAKPRVYVVGQTHRARPKRRARAAIKPAPARRTRHATVHHATHRVRRTPAATARRGSGKPLTNAFPLGKQKICCKKRPKGRPSAQG